MCSLVTHTKEEPSSPLPFERAEDEDGKIEFRENNFHTARIMEPREFSPQSRVHWEPLDDDYSSQRERVERDFFKMNEQITQSRVFGISLRLMCVLNSIHSSWQHREILRKKSQDYKKIQLMDIILPI